MIYDENEWHKRDSTEAERRTIDPVVTARASASSFMTTLTHGMIIGGSVAVKPSK
jgi:hypothetical protein